MVNPRRTKRLSARHQCCQEVTRAHTDGGTAMRRGRQALSRERIRDQRRLRCRNQVHRGDLGDRTSRPEAAVTEAAVDVDDLGHRAERPRPLPHWTSALSTGMNDRDRPRSRASLRGLVPLFCHEPGHCKSTGWTQPALGSRARSAGKRATSGTRTTFVIAYSTQFYLGACPSAEYKLTSPSSPRNALTNIVRLTPSISGSGAAVVTSICGMAAQFTT
jgi:hypothetical protein